MHAEDFRLIRPTSIAVVVTRQWHMVSDGRQWCIRQWCSNTSFIET